ncbi:integral peroxisomal membrane peroxin-domain-containing protein [Pseudoneurospora amorphoporcata]|uniref:Integral peroxisomal membrane peroxin-domain-containing protein n=1 Tax=Pseudoneurospora amorphoporcata TaxID=241081 RepID=A0AAN6NLX3_9PEZI|nr:integral peroxisomal membrane peroxin-domain-containing protein [Pseudoneurospora amorphoporcata]
MSAPQPQRSGDALSSHPSTPSHQPKGIIYSNDGAASNPNPTHASFSPATLSSTAPSATFAAKRRSTILVHQKSPLLLATPPQITRALAYSHPFLLPLNTLAGLITWTTRDPWESFLMVAVFWAAVLYGDIIVRVAGPVVLVLLLIGGMYGRRYSPLSSSGWTEPGVAAGDVAGLAGTDGKGSVRGKKAPKSKNLSVDGLPDNKNGKANGGLSGGAGAGAAGNGHLKNQGSVSEVTNTRHQKTLDEIVETLKEFTARCNILLEPMLELTDFLSTQRTPTSATTKPALTTLFIRILLCTPFWFALTLPPFRLITTRRVIMIFGTLILTWHSRVMRVSRAILWRSASIRRFLELVTGLQFEKPVKVTVAEKNGVASSAASTASGNSAKGKTFANLKGSKAYNSQESELTKALRRARGGHDTGVRFTFIIYENQRRWVGLGWTTSLFAYERPAWTDEHNNAVPQRDQFELPEVEDGSNMRWRWVEGSRWRVDGVPDEAVMPGEDADGKEWDYDSPGGRMGWVYYDNKWQNGRRGQDGWGRWTRRRKWYRDAELVEADDAIVEELSEDAMVDQQGNNLTVNGSANGNSSTDSVTPTATPVPGPGIGARAQPRSLLSDQLAASGEIASPSITVPRKASIKLKKTPESAADSLARIQAQDMTKSRMDMKDKLRKDKDAETEGGDDAASVVSTSSTSRSHRFSSALFGKSPTSSGASSAVTIRGSVGRGSSIGAQQRRNFTDAATTGSPSASSSGGGGGGGGGSYAGRGQSPSSSSHASLSVPSSSQSQSQSRSSSTSRKTISNNYNSGNNNSYAGRSRRSSHSNVLSDTTISMASPTPQSILMTAKANEEDEVVSSFGTQTRLALQDAGKNESNWGFGDEVRMGLE